MREIRTFAPGASALSVALSNAAPIRGIQVDNPSGGWLYVVSEQQWVPPYTIGWAMPLSYDQSSITIQYFTTGPASQVGTTAGDNWTLTVFDEAVAQSDGSQYQLNTGFAPLITSGGRNLVLNSANGYSSGGAVAGATPATGKRIRVIGTTHFVFSSGASFPPTYFTVGMSNDSGATVTNLWATMLTPINLRDGWNPAQPYDLPVSYALWITATQQGPFAGGTVMSIGNMAAFVLSTCLFTVI